MGEEVVRECDGALLEIDLGAVRQNYRRLRAMLKAGAQCGAVVKADGYGLGAAPIAVTLHSEGCNTFFVAHCDEGMALRSCLPASVTIVILNGLPPGAELECARAGLWPVLNSPEQVEAWSGCARRLGRTLDAVVQVDTGMNRLGLAPHEITRFADPDVRRNGIEVRLLMSHLACADDPGSAANEAQRRTFERFIRWFPGGRRSLANSSGIFLGSDFHHDLVRPGAALYGVNPLPGSPNPMRPVVRLRARVIQVRDLEEGGCVGYGWDFRAREPMRLATLAIGYADGLLRSFGNGGAAYFEGHRLAVVGRVSMDSVVVDVGEMPGGNIKPGAMVDIIGDDQSVDDLAASMNTIGYEVLTSFGHRFKRVYRNIAGSSVIQSGEGVPS